LSQLIYEDTDLTQLVTPENDFAKPEDESEIDGDTGETKYKYLWIAIEQTKLSAGINDTTEDIPLVAARFLDTNLPVIIIGTEKMKIKGRFGTDNVEVTRGYKGTTKASHNQNDPVYLCYNATGTTIVAKDNSGSDEAAWLTFCLAPGGVPDNNYNSHPTPLSLGSINYNQKVQIRRRVIVPASTESGAKDDLLEKVAANLKEYEI